MTEDSYSSFWAALGRPADNVALMRLRATLYTALRRYFEALAQPPAVLSKNTGISLGDISDIMQGEVERFTLDQLASAAAMAGLRMELTIYPPAAEGEA